MKKQYFLCVLLICGVFTAAMALVDGFIYFFDLPSILFLLIPVFLVLLSHFSPAEMAGAFRSAMAGYEATEKELSDSLLFFKTMQKALLVVSALGFLTGLIVLAGIKSDAATFRNGLGVAILIVYYAAALVMLVALPFKSAVKKKLNAARDQAVFD